MNSMLAAPLAAPLRGSQEPRVSLIPDTAVSFAAGDEALELAEMVGIDLDPWQAFVLRASLGEREDKKWAAFQVGLVVPRQCGKGLILEARELAGLFLFGEQLLIHSAHEQRTASEHFRRLLARINSVPKLKQRVAGESRGKGSEAIELVTGQRILFTTRTGGSARGLTGDFVAIDEAMMTPIDTTAALVPSMAATSMTGNPQIFFTGSAVDQQSHRHGRVFASVRRQALAGGPRLAFFEWSVKGDDPDQVPVSVLTDPASWARANPALGIRIDADHVENELAVLGSREFAVERLGVGDWPDPDQAGGDAVIDLDAWDDLVDRQSMMDGPVCLAFDVTPDRQRAAISVAGRRPDGLAHVEVVEHRKGTGWVADDLAYLVREHDVAGVCYVEGSPAASLVSQIPEAIPLVPVPTRKYPEACGGLYDAVDQTALRHLGTDELGAALKGAKKSEFTSGAWSWSRKSLGVDISPLVACTLALWGVDVAKPEAQRPGAVFI